MNYWIISDGASRVIIQASDEFAAWQQVDARWARGERRHKYCSVEPYIGAGK